MHGIDEIHTQVIFICRCERNETLENTSPRLEKSWPILEEICHGGGDWTCVTQYVVKRQTVVNMAMDNRAALSGGTIFKQVSAYQFMKHNCAILSLPTAPRVHSASHQISCYGTIRHPFHEQRLSQKSKAR
jgi:hypothetical protein